MNKLICNCTTGKVEFVPLTPEEIAQREYEASLQPVVPPKTELELLQEKYATLQGAMDFIVMML